MQSDYDNNLQSYFTDMEHLRGMFKDYVSAEKLPKRVIVIHGVGGAGKSSLLRMFRLQCKSEKVPVALASGDDAKSVLDVVTRWTEDLKEDGIKFPMLSKTLESYRAIQAKVEDQAKKSQNRVADIASKAASKTAEAAGGALLGAAIGSIVPGIGTVIGGALGGVVSGMGAEALTDWLRGFLSKPDIDLYVDPTKRFTSDFLEDIAKVAEKKRIVLLLDTFEQMSALEDWAGKVAQKIHPNVLMVIAGRKLPDWNRLWSGWMMNAQVEELKPMTEDVMRALISRYYATMRGGEPDPAQVEAIIGFARGLPMVVTSAVQLWVKYGVEDFQSVKVEIVANLVDRLMEGVPSSLIPALEAAAIVRWFDQPILRAVLNKEDVRDVYNELRCFPFVRTRIEGLALHDSVREMMDENLRAQDSERHAELHERAALYFEKRIQKATEEESERLGLEKLYHYVRSNEAAGINIFQEIAEDLTRSRLVNRLRALVNDANTYPLERENSKMWRIYYNARLAHLETRLVDAETVYKQIVENTSIDKKILAYAMSDLGWMLKRREYLRQPGIETKAISILLQSTNMGIPIDSKTALSWLYLSDIYTSKAKWDEATHYADTARNFFKENGHTSYLALILEQIRGIFARQGNWAKMMDTQLQIRQTLELPNTPTYLKARLIEAWDWLWIGRYKEYEISLLMALKTAKSIEDQEWITAKSRDLGLCLSLQDRHKESLAKSNEALNLAESWGKIGELEIFIALSFSGIASYKSGEFKIAEETLIKAIELGQRLQAHLDYAPLYAGMMYEVTLQFDRAEFYLNLSKTEAHQIDRHYYESSALTGLARVKHAQGDLAAILPLLAEAEQLAQQYEYNDHLASLRLTQGHLCAETSEALETSKVQMAMSALDYYKQAMIYALRFNRFLLDELLSGRPQGTPLRPIIPYCLEHGEEGKKILSALKDWWKTGVNDIGTPRPDTISPITEGVPLLEGERIAREREPGDGSMQRNVIEQLEAVL